MNQNLNKKSNSLKNAIDRYNTFKKFVDLYKSTESLDEYVEYIKSTSVNISENMSDYYDSIIGSYKRGNSEPLLSNLYNRLLDADERKNKIAEELKQVLKSIWK